MGTGSGSVGGSGYRVEVDSLRAFASQVRGLLSEFQSSADGTRAYNQTGVGRDAFGTFAEARALHGRYEEMRDALRSVLNGLQDLIDAAQHKADLTAANYEEQEHETARRMRLSGDGWSVAVPPGTAVGTSASYRGAPSGASGPAARPVPRPPVQPSPGGGQPQPTW